MSKRKAREAKTPKESRREQERRIRAFLAEDPDNPARRWLARLLLYGERAYQEGDGPCVSLPPICDGPPDI
jgi:hypothetical protein